MPKNLVVDLGDVYEVKILSISPSHALPPEDVAARLQETIRKAVEQSDLTNAITFASSYNGMWGDYDPAGLTNDPDQNRPG
jgi:hypothetical protein